MLHASNHEQVDLTRSNEGSPNSGHSNVNLEREEVVLSDKDYFGSEDEHEKQEEDIALIDIVSKNLISCFYKISFRNISSEIRVYFFSKDESDIWSNKVYLFTAGS